MARFVGNIAIPSRQEIWWVSTQTGVVDRKPVVEDKPWLVVQDNRRAGEVRWPQLPAVRVTGNLTMIRDSHVPLHQIDRFKGVVLVETLTALPRWWFRAHAGSVTPGTMRRVETALRAVLGMEEDR